MTKEEYLKELNKAFGNFKFYENGHYYTYKDKPISIGATGLIEQYTQDFDSQTIAERVALKQNKSIHEVLEEWQYKNKFACEKGSTCHEFAQSIWSHKGWQPLYFDSSEEYIQAVIKIQKQANNFYDDYEERLEHLADEFVIGSEEYDIASAIDHLFINKLTGGLVLVDYKTNSDIHKNERYAKKMKVPLSHLKDTTLNHYAIQLSIYKYLVEKYTNLKIEEMFIVWFSENIDNYQIIEVPYLKNEVEEILEIRRKKGMKCIPVLIMGASGTGKTFSFKNLPAEHTGIISVVKPKLPFRNKNKLSFYQCDNYEEIKQIIQKTDKKIICIDDTGYLMQFENFDKALIKGYDKHTEMAKHYADLLKVVRILEGEKIVYLTIHEDVIEGISKPKTTGKMINDNLCIEGLFDIVFRSLVKENEHVFQTRSSGESVAKTPYEMFDEEFIPNDLLEIDKTIREFYEFEPLKINNNKNESEDK